MRYDYDLVAIGGGAAGLVCTKMAHGMGLKSAIVEKRKLGGECTWFGCIPSKTLIKCAQIAHELQNLTRYGLNVSMPISLNTENVLSHVKSVVENTYNGHHPGSLQKLGIDIYHGEPEFIDRHNIKVGSSEISSKYFNICTGSSALIPQIAGIEKVPYLTNETLFELEKLPDSLMILGAGPVGIELAQALNRLGVKVTVLEMLERILSTEDEEVVNFLERELAKEGLTILKGSRALSVAEQSSNITLEITDKEGSRKNLEAQHLLVAAGRKPNSGIRSLEKTGVKFDKKEIAVDQHLRTSVPNIFASGDVIGPYRFSHMAEYQAVTATFNAISPLKRKVNYEHALWCTFTDPEIAHLGMTEREAREKFGDSINVYRHSYDELDRTKTDSAGGGIAKFICDKRGKIIGAHIVGKNAGDLIHEAQILKTLGIPLSKMYKVIHAYPTYADITRRAGRSAFINKLRRNPLTKFFTTGKNSKRKSPKRKNFSH